MAYQIISRDFVAGEDADRIAAVLDSADDLASLGTDYASGSVAVIAESGLPTYIMNASSEWREV